MEFKKVVIFGGAGFIGMHLARYLLEEKIAGTVVSVDIREPEQALMAGTLEQAAQAGQFVQLKADVRNNLKDLPLATGTVDLIVNLAAVHREPGHAPFEYFETNLNGAENTCAWAEQVGCNNIMFSSSIAPYGPSEEPKDEFTVPVPISAYGASKLAAEHMHRTWQRGGEHRRLLIVRPGVVFGPGENGNVSRLIRSVLGRYFFFMGNRLTRKAGGYVKELCRAMVWVWRRTGERHQGVILFNFTMDPAPTVAEWVASIQRVAGTQHMIPTVPFALLLGSAHAVRTLVAPFGVKTAIDPVRVRKLIRSNHIVPSVLREEKYPYCYTLDGALADWKRERPSDY